MNGYITVGYEFGAELTYPESESTSSGLLNASGEFFGVVAVLIAEVILKKYGQCNSVLHQHSINYFCAY